MEILGNKLKRFFDKVDNPPNDAEISYAGNRYEVWEVSEDLFNKMSNMSEDEFVKLAGEEAWWRQSNGSVLGVPDTYFSVHGERLLGWDSSIYESKVWHKYVNLSEYLCDCIGASTGKNVCACVTDLAKYNDMTIAELFDKYEGYSEKNACKDTITSLPLTDSNIPMPEVKPPKNAIPSASEANKMTNHAIDSCTTQQLAELSKLIRDAIADGKFSISEDGCLKPETRKKLEELGYKVETGTQYNESYYSISWRETK